MKRKLKWFFVVAVAGFALLQLTNPPRTNPTVISDLTATNSPPPQIAAMLHAPCYDWHSSETRWPWYSRVAPVSWLIASDVRDGRAHLNLSDWPTDDPMRAVKRLESMSDEIGSGEMRLKKYTQIHADARLTEIQRKELTDCLDAAVLKKIDVPTLILHGDDDQIVPIADSALLSAKFVKNATLKIYKGASHGLCSTLKYQVNEDLLAFIKTSGALQVNQASV